VIWIYLVIGVLLATALWRWRAAFTRRHTRASARMVPIEGREVASVEGIFGLSDAPRPPRQLPNEVLYAAFRSDELPIPADAERDDERTLVGALRLAADHLGASDCVLWVQDADDTTTIELLANSRESPAVVSASDRAMVLWSAQEGVIAGDTGGEQRVRLLVAPVRLGDYLGALSAHFEEDPTSGRTVLREWLIRHAANIGALHELLRTRAESAKRNYKLRAMIRTAKTLQGSRDPQALEQMLVRDSLIVVGGAWGVLVRWDSQQRHGIVRVATDGAPSFGVRPEARQGSLVGEVCLSGAPRVFSDTRALIAAGEPVFDGVPLPAGTGSLLVVPLRRSEQEPVAGALLCGHRSPRALRTTDAHAARELGVIAAGALETAWAVQEATERARTDQLTGIANRRHFNEMFARMIGETDRYGGSAALVLADIDFFQNVNDPDGHEAGDVVLIAVAHALAGERRTTDFAARIGGEEIALLLPQTDVQGAREVSERLRARVESLVVKVRDTEIRVTASFGVAMYTARSGAGPRLFERADKALYVAKNGGRNRVELTLAEGAWTS
jgi:diguanylate cyclase (GGDEF)-like protein